MAGVSFRVKRPAVNRSTGATCAEGLRTRGCAMAGIRIWSLVVPFLILAGGEEEKVVYRFQEFFYKGNSKNEIAFREFESACEQNPDCASKVGAERFACVRRCISPSCHQDLYGHDPLEEGEIDVRLNSFKGCFIQRLNRPRQ